MSATTITIILAICSIISSAVFIAALIAQTKREKKLTKDFRSLVDGLVILSIEYDLKQAIERNDTGEVIRLKQAIKIVKSVNKKINI